MNRIQPIQFLVLAAIYLYPAIDSVSQTDTADPGDWPSYAGNAGFNRYVPLAQIDRENVSTLERVWKWNSIDEPLYDGHRRFFPMPVINRSDFKYLGECALPRIAGSNSDRVIDR